MPPLAVSVAEYAAPTLPLDSEVVVTVTPGAMAMDSDCAGEVVPLLSLTVTLKMYALTTAEVGVPPITPRCRVQAPGPEAASRPPPTSCRRGPCRRWPLAWPSTPRLRCRWTVRWW